MEDVIIIGSGLAGLSTAMELVEQGRRVTILERHKVVGGRTASWNSDGMEVESGLHRWLGFYRALPQLCEKAGLDVDKIVKWEDRLEIRMPDGGPCGILPLSSYKPVRTLAGLLGNWDLIPPKSKAALAYFFSSGLIDYNLSREALDHNTVEQYAHKRGVPEEAISQILIPVTEGIFFLPPQRYSAMVLMGLMVPALKRPQSLRVGSFLGGMTEVMAGPIADAIVHKGGRVIMEAEVERLAVTPEGRVHGVYYRSPGGGAAQLLEGNHVVVATSLDPAKELIRDALPDHPWFRDMLALPSMPAVTLQLELSEPSLPYDHVIFSPHTFFASYAEQCRTTFRETNGRLSIDMARPEELIDQEPEEIYRRAMADAPRIGLGDLESKVTRYRVVTHPSDFYFLGPGSEALRPQQATPVPGLSLAGDYTSQALFCSMEGAVMSGQRAAKAVLEAPVDMPIEQAAAVGSQDRGR